MIAYRRRPSAGFLVIIVVAAMSVAFFAWGLSTPPLDRLRQLEAELEAGERGALHPAERALLEKSLKRYPELAATWLDGARVRIISRHEGGLIDKGYAYLVKRAGEVATLEVSLTPGQKHGVTVSARVGEQKSRAVVEPDRPWLWKVGRASEAELVELVIDSNGRKKPTPVLVRVLEAP
jgi:hypothetical protein